MTAEKQEAPLKPSVIPQPPAATGMIELLMLIRFQGVNVNCAVGITEVKLADLLSVKAAGVEGLHKELVKAAMTGIELMAKQYQGESMPMTEVDKQKMAAAQQRAAA